MLGPPCVYHNCVFTINNAQIIMQLSDFNKLMPYILIASLLIFLMTSLQIMSIFVHLVMAPVTLPAHKCSCDWLEMVHLYSKWFYLRLLSPNKAVQFIFVLFLHQMVTMRNVMKNPGASRGIMSHLKVY